MKHTFFVTHCNGGRKLSFDKQDRPWTVDEMQAIAALPAVQKVLEGHQVSESQMNAELTRVLARFDIGNSKPQFMGEYREEIDRDSEIAPEAGNG